MKEDQNLRNRFNTLERRFQEIGINAGFILEVFVAFLVFVACVIGIVQLFPAAWALYCAGGTSEALIVFLEEVFAVVIGIEFLKMLCKPNSANVLETIIFLVARHMILATTTPKEDLCSVVAIVLLILAKRYLSVMLKKEVREAKEENSLANRT